MAICCVCDNKIGGWGEEKYVINKEKDIIACYRCSTAFKKMDDAQSLEAFNLYEKEITGKLCNSSSSPAIKEEVRLHIKGRKFRFGADVGVEQYCPVCNQVNTGEKCAECGYDYTNNHERPVAEKASILNGRYEQYEKNPMYEYTVETVSDSAVLGKFDKDEVNNLLMKYALDGWKLHTAFSNEIGKNAALGINATINQTVLIFERCIKG